APSGSTESARKFLFGAWAVCAPATAANTATMAAAAIVLTEDLLRNQFIDRQASRRTSAGSIRDARQAGRLAAATPTAARTIAAPMSVDGSRGRRPYRSAATNAEAQRLIAAPMPTPTATSTA